MRSSAPAEMSLSRRFLSLPQELPGASLPPQVAGQRCGTVTLCVPHILSSAVSSRPLPRVALVRVRWWGEQAPDSLFRPSLLSADGGGSSHRATAMKYPVNVQPAQLVEYFEDMRHLTLDVIDRDARKKVGECRLSLELERDNAVMTAEEKLVALRRDNALCEIKPTGAHEQDEVLGYLAVSFDVQWTDETKWRSREQEESEQVEEADRRVISVLDEKEEEVVVKKENREESGRSDDFQRIQKLLAKGKTLQQSMERAVREKENGEGGEVDVGIGEEGGGYFNAVHELASYSDFTSITGELDEHQPRSPASKSHIRPAPSVARENKGATQVNNGIDLGFLKHSENGSSGEANDGEVDSFDLSSISSSRSEENLRPKYQGDRSFGKSNPQSSPAITHSQVQHQVRGNDYPSKFAGSELFQFGVMIDDVSNVKPFAAIDRLPPSNCDQTKSIVSNGGNVDSNVISQEAASISLHYSVPSVFTRMSQPSIKFERTVRRKLRSSRWPGSTPSLSADFMGSIHVFQSVFAYDASEYFSDGYLIVEAWLQYTNAESTLLGLSKLPLRDFAEFFRSDEVDLLGYRKQILPIASVDGKFAIENPFTGHVAGYLHVRVSMGTAEQLLVWATTIKAIVRLQSVVRGALYRKQPDRPRYDLMNQNSRNPVTDATDARVVALSTEDSRSDSQSTAPTIAETTRMIAPHEKCTSIDMGEQRAQNYLDDPDAVLEIFNTTEANGNNQIDLSNEFRMQARIVLDPEVVAILQEECAEVVVLVWCSTCSKLHEIGHAEVPLAAVLFRPQGVKGMFPIRVGTDPSGSRIGVHCFVDHFPHSPRRDISEPKLKLVTQPLMSPTSPDEALHAEHSSSDAYLIKNSCEVCIEEGRNMDAVDANVEYPGFYATFRVTYDEWNYRAVFSVGDNRWRSLSLEVSVWQCVSNQRDRLDGFGSLGAGEQFDNPKGALLVGKLRVDLSLFAHGWRDINGWYHVLDDQLQRRGQIKVHITNLSVADTMRTAASINSISDDFPNASKYLQLPHEVHDGECGLFDEDGAESHSSSDKYTQAIYQNPEALRTQQKNLKVSGQTPLQTPGKVNDFAIVTYDSMQMYGDVERFLSLSHSAERKASLASQGAEPGVDQLNREKVSSDSEGAVDVLSTPVHNSNTDCEFHQEGSTMSANDIRSNSDDSDGGSLAINTEFFKPITLASFGIEEMELSPFGVDEEMSPDKFAAPSTTAILPQTCEDLEHGAMSGDIEEERSSQKGGVEVEEDSDDEECQFKEEASSQNGGVEVDEESGDEDSGDEELRDVWKNDVVDATVDSPDSLYDKRADGVSSANASSGYPEQQTPDCIENSKNDHESTLPTMQNEKLELVYEMLREMRDSYFGKLLTKPSVAPGAVICGASDMQPVYDKSSFVSHEGNVGDKRCSCPCPTASTVPISPKARELIFDESIARDMPSSIGLEQQAFVHSSKRISPPQLPAVGLHNSSIPSALRSSLRSTDGVNQFQVSAGIRRLSSSDIPESKARYSRQAVEKDGHSSVHSLFAHDSETERIARIMQGSMNYWMKDDSSSSCDDGEIDEEETDDDCYF
ncbi:hypothetical protein PF001_g582 [Phytophthora fragariae]|uniref:C2CD3 N-terminal C2 domain-containing protein n=1 Tax=Phytophthora fragariae TaxID=53985 RepID=A0A6A4F7D9_9STRA|nr:hypothetical protein PF001_g582 [Phytophthora fragariae]